MVLPVSVFQETVSTHLARFVCVYGFMCLHAYVHVRVCVFAHADKKLALNIFLSHSCFGVLRQGLFLTLEFADIARCSQHPSVSTSLALEFHVHIVCTQLFFFTWDLGIKLRTSCLHGKCFTSQASHLPRSLAPIFHVGKPRLDRACG